MSPLNAEAVEEVTCRSVLTPASGFLGRFTHSLNPYMGCAFGDGGCGVYCYVAESPIGLHAGMPWGQWVKAKVNAADALRRDLDRCRDAGPVRVFMSSATDPYQPAEARLRITRSILEVFAERPIALLVVQTRSPLVERDLDLLARMPFAWLSMTVETNDDAVRRSLTPACPSIERRFATMRRARERGIQVQAAVSPALPHDVAQFAGLLEASADRVVVDTFFGDGSNGKRTGRRPLPARYAELGYGDWRNPSAAERLYETLAASMGSQRVGWSQDGFNELSVRAASVDA
ncbi:MAG: radical SAM protein [Dehalococcoidia bacterium]